MTAAKKGKKVSRSYNGMLLLLYFKYTNLFSVLMCFFLKPIVEKDNRSNNGKTDELEIIDGGKGI